MTDHEYYLWQQENDAQEYWERHTRNQVEDIIDLGIELEYAWRRYDVVGNLDIDDWEDSDFPF